MTAPPNLTAVAAAAAAAEVAVVCVATEGSEGSDRDTLSLTDAANAMVAAVAAAQPQTVVSVNNPGAMVLPWAASANAIVASWLPGQEVGCAPAGEGTGRYGLLASLPPSESPV
jgi:beta-glucosidase